MSQEVLKKSLSEMLLAGAFIDQVRLEEAEAQAQAKGVPLQRVLVTERYLDPKTVATMVSFVHGVPIADIALFRVWPGEKPLPCIPSAFARQRHVLPVAWGYGEEDCGKLLLAMEDPTDRRTIAEVEELIGMPVWPIVSLGNLYHQLEAAYPDNPA